jgi:hypothetical protein
MANIEYSGGGYKEPIRGKSGGPRQPEKVLKIVHLREIKELSWRKIAALVGGTHQGPYLLYKRWHEWAKEQRV